MKLYSAFILGFLITTLSVCSQKPQANTHVTVTKLDKFQGTWRAIVGLDTFKIKLAKLAYKYFEPQNATVDRLLGTHYYSDNGRVIQSSMNKYDSIVAGYQDRATVVFWRNSEMDTSKVEGVFYDLSKNKVGTLLLQYVSGTTPQIIWKLKNVPGPKSELPGETFDPYFRLPSDLTFIKQ